MYVYIYIYTHVYIYIYNTARACSPARGREDPKRGLRKIFKLRNTKKRKIL